MLQRIKTTKDKGEILMLEKINAPSDMQGLSDAELDMLASEIREFLIKNISKTGGHLAANLGVVELTMALLLEFDPFKDRIVWDVGHQSYVHKILTGRRDEFENLRKFGGLSGFPKIAESKADAFNSGHSSTSVSAAAGFAAAAALSGSDICSVAVIGDGAMTGGMVYEALNHIGSINLPVVVILNDNGMSISENVGGFANRLKKIRTTAGYFRIKSNIKSALDKVPLIGKPIKRFMSMLKRVTRKLLLPNMMFEDFGFKYLGPVDGHDIDALRTIMKQAKKIKAPVLVHVHTEKGKGYEHAEKKPDFFHGIQSFDEKTGMPISSGGCGWSECFGDKLCSLAEKNDKIVAITAAMPLGTGLCGFAEKFPERFFDVAIAEQHAITFAAALAGSGYVPVAAIYSTFLQRAYDQIIHDVSLMTHHVVFCIDRCGPVGSDGETHQGMYDIAFMTQIPGMTVFSPSCRDDFEQMLEYATDEMNTPVAVRYPRGNVTERETNESNPYKSVLLKEGTDVLIAAVGITVYDALSAAEMLEKEGVSVAVADVRCIKPIDKEFMIKNSEGKKLVVSVEDGIETGGFGQQLESLLGRNVLKFAYPDEPVVQGSVDEIKDKYGVSAAWIKDGILNRGV